MPQSPTHHPRIRPSYALLLLLLASGCSGGDDNGKKSSSQSGSPEMNAGSNLDTPSEISGPEASDVRPRDEYGIPLDAPVSAESRALVGELIENFRPIALDLTSDHHDRQIWKQREIYQQLIKGGTDVGNAALHAYTGAKDEPMIVRRALLWVGGKAAPKESENLLAHLFDTYGLDIADRTEAALVLAETSPDRYMEVARPYLERRERLKKFMPDDEFLVAGWVNANIVKGTSPIPMLADVSTNLLMMPNARSLAAKRMREFPNEMIGQRALEACLIESSGDNYLRIMAAQSLAKLLPRETSCALFEETLARETNPEMAKFLQDMVQVNCR